MSPNRGRFNQSPLFPGHAAGEYHQPVLGYHKQILGNSRGLETLNFQMPAGIVLPPFAGPAYMAYQLRPGSCFHTRSGVNYRSAHGFHHCRILMALYHGIGRCRMHAMVYMDIGSANAYLFDSQQHFMIAERSWFRYFPEFNHTG
jgi:hypothetical protein